MSSHQLKESSIRRHGIRPLRKVSYDDDFHFQSMPTTRSGKVRLKCNKPITVNNKEYWHSCFISAPKISIKVPVRYDPFDIEHTYIYHNKCWLKCRLTRQYNGSHDYWERALMSEVGFQEASIRKKMSKLAYEELSKLTEDLDERMIEKYEEISFDMISNKETKEKDLIVVEKNNDLVPKLSIWDLDMPDSVNLEKK